MHRRLLRGRGTPAAPASLAATSARCPRGPRPCTQRLGTAIPRRRPAGSPRTRLGSTADAAANDDDGASTSTPPPSITPADRAHMRRALELARRGLGKTEPNPAVGCVIVAASGGGSGEDERVVGEGFHPRAGKPHAEVYALRAAGQKARGATAYVTLEPCAHHGRTPPCARALVDAGVERVVLGVVDPNPLVDGGGVSLLRAAGIEVVAIDGEEAREAEELNPEFMRRMREGAARAAAEAAKKKV